eukprot:TRINITY_DN8800_c0_g1_i3.p1 TRINITY_DN8800_c0_g1~~TRINITY_DN8800_c0_g1_i3.p1  ORF type:complete len:348 (+),score=64.84 TRINITY_DN8800_c0_g1_i3:73-1116(+)
MRSTPCAAHVEGETAPPMLKGKRASATLEDAGDTVDGRQAVEAPPAGSPEDVAEIAATLAACAARSSQPPPELLARLAALGPDGWMRVNLSFYAARPFRPPELRCLTTALRDALGADGWAKVAAALASSGAEADCGVAAAAERLARGVAAAARDQDSTAAAAAARSSCELWAAACAWHAEHRGGYLGDVLRRALPFGEQLPSPPPPQLQLSPGEGEPVAADAAEAAAELLAALDPSRGTDEDAVLRTLCSLPAGAWGRVCAAHAADGAGSLPRILNARLGAAGRQRAEQALLAAGAALEGEPEADGVGYAAAVALIAAVRRGARRGPAAARGEPPPFRRGPGRRLGP